MHDGVVDELKSPKTLICMLSVEILLHDLIQKNRKSRRNISALLKLASRPKMHTVFVSGDVFMLII